MDYSEVEEFSDFLAEDNSGDKKYFTIIPNYVMNIGLNPNELALYLTIKRFAGETGECFLTKSQLTKKTQISRATLKRCMSKLLDLNLIYPTGYKSIQTKGGPQLIVAYGVSDVWALNNFENVKQRGAQIDHTFSTKGGSNVTAKGGSNVTANKNNNTIKNIITSESLDCEFSLQEELKKLEQSPLRQNNIVGHILEETGVELLNRGQFTEAFRRHIRSANRLKVFTDEQIVEATEIAKKNSKDYGWSGETLLKILTK